jgi:hypothetical protein
MLISLFQRWPMRLAVLGGYLLATALGQAADKKAAPKDDFMPYVELAPFVVNGQRLAISIHARNKKDRRYAEDFAEEVVKVVNEGVTKETGKGLVIIGRKGEPHPIFVFRKFLALAGEGKLDPAVAARAPELSGMLNHWQDTANEGKGFSVETDGDAEVDMEFDKIVTALPLPLEGMGAQLYQLAWGEGFDDKKVEARLRALKAADLDGNLFARFDWVFYLPPRGALENAIDDLIATALKEEDIGFLARTAVKGALLFAKPMIRKAIEGVRQGLLFDTVVRARTEYSPEEVSDLTGTYLEVLMPDTKDKTGPGTEHERAVRNVAAKVKEIAAKPTVKEENDETNSSGKTEQVAQKVTEETKVSDY